jgi:hypothetical protein
VPRAIGIGSALGLAWLTKGTTYLFSLPIMLTFALTWPTKIRYGLKGVFLLLLVAVGLTAGHFARNYTLYGSPFGPHAEGPGKIFKYTNDEISVSTLVSNIVRNVALHIGTGTDAVNIVLERWMVRLIQAVGAEVNDPRTTWDFATFHIPKTSMHESHAGNPVHVILIVLILTMMLCQRNPSQQYGDVLQYAFGLVLAFILFCVLLKWQPWHSRLHLPLFVLWSAAVAVVLTQRWPRGATIGLAIILLVCSCPFLIKNQLRPLTGENNIFTTKSTHLYFADRRSLEQSFVAATAFVRETRCRDIGLDFYATEPFEYPLLVLLGAESGEKNVRHLNVKNLSAIYAAQEYAPQPCAVICVNCAKQGEKWKEYAPLGGAAYVFDDITVFATGSVFQWR